LLVTTYITFQKDISQTNPKGNETFWYVVLLKFGVWRFSLGITFFYLSRL